MHLPPFPSAAPLGKWCSRLRRYHVTTSFPDRDRLWADIAEGVTADWDVIIIGGGITGAGILREAVSRGYRCLLVEQRDFAWGTCELGKIDK